MNLLNNGGDRAPIGHLSSPNETSSTGNKLHLIKFLAKGVHGSLQTTQAIVKAVGDLLQTE